MTTALPAVELQHFADLAESYCRLLEQGDATPAQLTQSLHVLLADLHVAALRLPAPPPTDEAPEPPEPHLDLDAPTPSPLEGVRRVVEHLGSLVTYREIFDPHDWEDESQCAGDIEDDLGDIHADLAEGLTHWRAGNPSEALWHWRFHFRAHWGKHAISALHALHTACAWHDMPWPADEQPTARTVR